MRTHNLSLLLHGSPFYAFAHKQLHTLTIHTTATLTTDPQSSSSFFLPSFRATTLFIIYTGCTAACTIYSPPWAFCHRVIFTVHSFRYPYYNPQLTIQYTQTGLSNKRARPPLYDVSPHHRPSPPLLPRKRDIPENRIKGIQGSDSCCFP